MKKTFAKLGKLILEEYLAINPFNEPLLEVESSNERVNLDLTFSPEEEIISLENGFFKKTQFYCWNPVMGMTLIKFTEQESFLEAIPKANEELIVHVGILPTHLVKKTTMSKEPKLPGWAKGDSVCYMIYYLHPDQRDAIEITYRFSSYEEAMQAHSDMINELTSVGRGSWAH